MPDKITPYTKPIQL